MSKAGIVGLPNVGKSTLFNALVGSYKAEAGNFPFCTIDPNVGIVSVPDDRLDTLKELENSDKIVPATFEFVDIAGLVKGANEGAGLGNKFLSHIREVHTIVHVVRCFEDENVHHVDGSINPMRDLETIYLELALADLAVVQKRKERLEKACKTGDKASKEEFDILTKIEETLENSDSLNSIISLRSNLPTEELERIAYLNLLVLKPFLIAANLKEDELKAPKENKNYKILCEKFSEGVLIPISAQIEAELASLNDETEAKEYLESLGVKESGVKELIRKAFDALGLMTYFTVGKIEARAWTVRKNSTAPEAAGVIHTDFQRGFIKAEIISFDELVKCGSKASAREQGKLRLEGKEYIVQEADVIEFKFNV